MCAWYQYSPLKKKKKIAYEEYIKDKKLNCLFFFPLKKKKKVLNMELKFDAKIWEKKKKRRRRQETQMWA